MASILLDTFTGAAGPLSAHTPDVGGAWGASGAYADLLRLDGAGLLALDQPETTVVYSSGQAIPQADLSIEVVVDIGPINTNPAYDRFDRVVVSLWGWYDFSIEVANGVSAATAPRLYPGHRLQGNPIAVTAGESHTVRWDVTLAVSTVKMYVDGVLNYTAAGQLRKDVGSTALGGYFDRSQTAGAPNLPTMLRASSFHVYDAGPPPPPPAFWEAFRNSHEVM